MDRKQHLIEQFVKSIDSSVDVTFDDSEFYADIEDNEINVPLTDEYDEGGALYIQFLQERYFVTPPLLLISILHEVGHLQTFDEELNCARSIKYFLLQMSFEEGKEKEYNYAYFQLPSEKEATEWAVNFYLNNKEFCDNFATKIERLGVN